ncbi:MAG TPA: type II CAAX endopeptidase family protein [Trebonia sp.]|nr:type II CAAX endopeptidase family protein [Trebonia sp.]
MTYAGTRRHRDRTGLRGLIRRHPLVSFFALAAGLSWAAWIPYVLSESGLGIAHFNFPVVLGNTQLTGVLPGAYLGPILSAFVVTAAADGRPGLRQWTGRLLRWRVGWRWYAGAVTGVPAVLVLISAVLSGGRIQAPAAAALTAYLPMLLLQMVTTGLAEEPGWRDFALPRLQRRFGPLRATAILGPLWGAWHLPLFLTAWGGWPHVTPQAPVEFILACCAFSYVMTWVFNRSGESLPVAMLVHTSVNTFMSLAWVKMFPSLPASDGSNMLLIASVPVALVLIAATRGRLGYRPERGPRFGQARPGQPPFEGSQARFGQGRPAFDSLR